MFGSLVRVNPMRVEQLDTAVGKLSQCRIVDGCSRGFRPPVNRCPRPILLVALASTGCESSAMNTPAPTESEATIAAMLADDPSFQQRVADLLSGDESFQQDVASWQSQGAASLPSGTVLASPGQSRLDIIQRRTHPRHRGGR